MTATIAYYDGYITASKLLYAFPYPPGRGIWVLGQQGYPVFTGHV